MDLIDLTIFDTKERSVVRIHSDTIIGDPLTTQSKTGYGVVIQNDLILTSSALCLTSPLLIENGITHNRIIVEILFQNRSFIYEAHVIFVNEIGGYGVLRINVNDEEIKEPEYN